jgi:hypothetical protein
MHPNEKVDEVWKPPRAKRKHWNWQTADRKGREGSETGRRNKAGNQSDKEVVMSGKRGVDRRKVVAGAGAVVAMLPLHQTAWARGTTEAAVLPELVNLDRELAEKLTRFRVLRTQELTRLWNEGSLEGINAYDRAARDCADTQTGLIRTALNILWHEPDNPAEEAITRRSGDAFREYCLPSRDWPAVVSGGFAGVNSNVLIA